MAILGGKLGVAVLQRIAPRPPDTMQGRAYRNQSKIEVLLGPAVWDTVRGRTVVDFGCGAGDEAIEIALKGAGQVYAVDIQESLLDLGRKKAAACGCRNIDFSTQPPEAADLIISLDSFEHFADPQDVMQTMAGMLKPHGTVMIAFGPTWYHPLGGHLFSVFPWAHLIFSERALCQWRSQFRQDRATRFSQVEGGLNQLTIRRFLRLIKANAFEIVELKCVPIRGVAAFHNRLTREFLTATVRCVLQKSA